MLSRAFTKQRRSSPQAGESRSSVSIYEYEEFIFGSIDDIPLISFDEYIDKNNRSNNSESTQMTLRQVLRASVGVIGESSLGMTEKVVLLGGKICAVKRFTKVLVKKREFGWRIERVAHVSSKCEYLVPVTAYLYAKRIKFLVCDYYPMGSLADLLFGAREKGQTALEWKHILKIVQSTAKAIAFIHSQHPPKEKNLQLNVHGNIKSSNVMINIDFTARLSDYGFVQLAEQVAVVDDTGQAEPPAQPPQPTERVYSKTLSQKSDIYNFGVVLLEILESLGVKKNQDIVEFSSEGRQQRQVSKVLEIALSCTDVLPEARPDIEHILFCVGDSVNC
ncbi:hypothetical protein ACJIZ3_001892 [Penstemon smallii]|uniref:Protein kinase domain-containing protein n=1 Tax=Penstemon smallii TaxID=265156 RepID=A0ABD3U4X2_9LAMI